MSQPPKRPRPPSQPSSPSSSPRARGPPKASRTAPPAPTTPSTPGTPGPAALLCTLPPTCSRRPTALAGTRELEAHYASHHAHVCAALPACACVFPDARLLELHQTECHDPLAALRMERGEKIFACHLATCARRFRTPKARRLHLISAHGFPKEYFFAVTNRGVGGLLRRWGDGASLVRGQWRPRPAPGDKMKAKAVEVEGKSVGDGDGDGDDVMRADDGSGESDDDDSGDGDGDGKGSDGSSDSADNDDDDDDEGTPGAGAPLRLPGADAAEDDDAMAGLARTLTSLALVPPSIRFGRGGKNGGFAGRGRGYARGYGYAGRGAYAVPGKRGDGAGMDVDAEKPAGAAGRGLGWAGRGRAGIVRVSGAGRGRGKGVAGDAAAVHV